MRKNQIAILLLSSYLALQGCESMAQNRPGPARPAPAVHPGTTADVDAVYEQLSFIKWATFPATASPQDRAPEYAIDRVLSRLHSWLSDGVGLYPYASDGYEYLVLEEIPEKVLRELQAITYKDDVRTGFGILHASFWESLAQRQKEGLHVGFITRAPSLVAGIYYSQLGFLAFDLFANGGTMIHEFRHHEQHQEIGKRRRHWDRYTNWRRNRLKSPCLESVSSYLGELDATTQQLPTWTGVIRELPVLPRDEEQARRIDSWYLMTIPQLLSANLEYPVSAADWVLQDASCPEALKGVIRELKIELTRQKMSVADDTLAQLYTVRAARIRAGSDPAAVARVEADLSGRKQKIEQALAELVRTRPSKVRAILDRIPTDLHYEMCERATAFSFLATCEQ